MQRILSGRYEIERIIAEGGMGVVYSAIQLQLDRRVAIKIFDKSEGDAGLDRRFMQEAATLAKLDHPNIVTIHDFGEEGDELFIVMELVDGRAMGRILEMEGPMPAGRAIRIAIEIARAVAAAHKLGVVHRDLKPDNVMVSTDGDIDTVHVLDFGLAKILDGRVPHEAAKELTLGPTLMGSPPYMSPEQICSETIDARSDIYSFGALMYHMVAGAPPFEAANHRDTIRQHLDAPVPAILQRGYGAFCPQDLEAIIQQCLAKAPEDRFQHMDEVISALRQLHSSWLMEVPNPIARTTSSASFPAPMSEPTRSTVPLHTQTLAPHPQSNRQYVLPTLLLLAVFSFGASVLWWLQRPTDLQVVPARTGATAPLEVRVTFRSTPTGSKVFEGNIALGVTPFIRQFPHAEHPEDRSFKFAYRGYETMTAIARFDRDTVVVRAELEPVSQEAVPAAAVIPEVRTNAKTMTRPRRRSSPRRVTINAGRRRVPRLDEAPPSAVPMLTEPPRSIVPQLDEAPESAVPLLDGPRPMTKKVPRLDAPPPSQVPILENAPQSVVPEL